MKKRRSIRSDKKGVSPLIIAVFVALITITLISALFIGIVTQSSSVLKSSKNQQERMQEALVLQGPNGMQLVGSGSSLVGALRVNNTGTVMVRIRALYIGEVFVCDPSTFQDTYIPPKESKLISLISGAYSPVTVNNTVLQAQWTVTTERGVSASEKGDYILFGRPGDENSPLRHALKTGPLLILFDFFNWRSGTGSWESGWAIPKSTADVTWRIYLINIDKKTITIGSSSFFDLVANTNNQGQDQKWFVNPTSAQQKTLVSGKGMFVEFNAKVNGQPQAITLNPGVSCLNFLAITGTFDDNSAFGQTIPFEAVLITDTPSMTLSANPQTIAVGSSQSTITATMIDASGNSISNQLVTFSTNFGTLSAPIATTDNAGVATVKLTAGSTTGTATITATAMGITKTTTVTITTTGATPTPSPSLTPTPTPTPTLSPSPTPSSTPIPTAITVSCNPTSIQRNGVHSTTISGNLGVNVAGKTINIYYQSGAPGPNTPPSGGTWNLLTQVTTNGNGAYSYNWDPDNSVQKGYCWIRAEFVGAVGYSSSLATTGSSGNINLQIT